MKLKQWKKPSDLVNLKLKTQLKRLPGNSLLFKFLRMFILIRFFYDLQNVQIILIIVVNFYF